MEENRIDVHTYVKSRLGNKIAFLEQQNAELEFAVNSLLEEKKALEEENKKLQRLVDGYESLKGDDNIVDEVQPESV